MKITTGNVEISSSSHKPICLKIDGYSIYLRADEAITLAKTLILVTESHDIKMLHVYTKEELQETE